MRIHKPRGLNIDESYACSRTAVRKCFDKQEISISWGNPAKYPSGSKLYRQAVEGIVVASLSVKRWQLNPSFGKSFRRPLPMLQEGRLYFYIIADSTYANPQKDYFAENCLPRLRQWYDARIAPDLPVGTDEMIVIWNGEKFTIREQL